ncbi:hypothetical protein PUN28_009258 [Cardiocondyla obscurior]|uniref:Uncharacterized protein n=1 Tax=Cardiocondyla obscurior TaxID=286306 RepID=A0AAW2FUI2_9HYME
MFGRLPRIRNVRTHVRAYSRRVNLSSRSDDPRSALISHLDKICVIRPRYNRNSHVPTMFKGHGTCSTRVVNTNIAPPPPPPSAQHR